MKKTLPLLALAGLFTLGAPLAQAQAPGAGSAWTETAQGRVIQTGTPQAKVKSAKSAKKKSVAAAKGKAGKKKATKVSAAQKAKKKAGAKALTASGKSRKTARSLH
ncbi:MAG: hypothetical protein ACOVLH_09970 [Roseateles sp.]